MKSILIGCVLAIMSSTITASADELVLEQNTRAFTGSQITDFLVCIRGTGESEKQCLAEVGFALLRHGTKVYLTHDNDYVDHIAVLSGLYKGRSLYILRGNW
jgi:hypothetical protein